MSITSVRSIETTMDIDGDGHTQYTNTYEVTVTDPLETPNDVSTATGIPLYGDPYIWGSGGDPNAFCNGKHVSMLHREGSNLFRVVTATFSTRDTRRARASNNLWGNPLDEEWILGGTFVNGTRCTCIDKDGKPTETTAHEIKWFDVPDGYDTLTIEGATALIHLPTRAQAVRKVNSAAIWGLDARMVYMAQWQWHVRFHGPNDYAYHFFEFHINYEKWNEYWFNMGTQHLNDAGKIAANPVSNDSLANNIRFLDAAGHILPESSIPGSVITNTDQIIKEFDFHDLGTFSLPDPLPGPFA